MWRIIHELALGKRDLLRVAGTPSPSSKKAECQTEKSLRPLYSYPGTRRTHHLFELSLSWRSFLNWKLTAATRENASRTHAQQAAETTGTALGEPWNTLLTFSKHTPNAPKTSCEFPLKHDADNSEPATDTLQTCGRQSKVRCRYS